MKLERATHDVRQSWANNGTKAQMEQDCSRLFRNFSTFFIDGEKSGGREVRRRNFRDLWAETEREKLIESLVQVQVLSFSLNEKEREMGACIYVCGGVYVCVYVCIGGYVGVCVYECV